jgi:4-amino-4-deoxy-L-arabinose transferase-like glycosyltransferase
MVAIEPTTAPEPKAWLRSAAGQSILVFGLIVVLVTAWTICELVSNGHGAIHEDMAEAYAWGSHFQLGYSHHPPFWSWIAGAWFTLWPRTTWAFAILSALNIAVGLWGAWMLIGRFAEDEKRLAAFALLLTTPLYAFLAFTFNANMIFVSLWPWTAYFLVCSLDQGRARDAILFGLFAAADVLSKYYAGVLLLPCLIVVLIHPNRDAYLRSKAPYLSIAAGAPFVGLHAWWLANHDYSTFHFLAGESGLSLPYSLSTALRTFGGEVAYQAGAIALVAWMGRAQLLKTPARLRDLMGSPRFRILAVLALGPLAFTIIVGVLLRMKVNTAWAVGVMPLISLLMIEALPPRRMERLARAAVVVALAIGAVAVAAAPTAAIIKLRSGDGRVAEPRVELALAATRIWHAKTGAPLVYVSGTDHYAGALNFYSTDRPSYFIAFDFRRAPWVDPADLKRRGLLVVCVRSDAGCLANARRFGGPNTSQTAISLSHAVDARHTGRPVDFLVFVTPPQA